MASSSDGFCTLVTFDEGELGIPYVPEEKQADVKDSESSSDAPSIDLKSESRLRTEPVAKMAQRTTSPNKLVRTEVVIQTLPVSEIFLEKHGIQALRGLARRFCLDKALKVDSVP